MHNFNLFFTSIKANDSFIWTILFYLLCSYYGALLVIDRALAFIGVSFVPAPLTWEEAEDILPGIGRTY